MGEIVCFLLEKMNLYRVQLRRYSPGDRSTCPGRYGYHNGFCDINIVELNEAPLIHDGPSPEFPKDEPRWPKKCHYCDYAFQDDDTWQVNYELIWKKEDGTQYTLNYDYDEKPYPGCLIQAAPPGAIWRAEWYEGHAPHKSPDGKIYVVRTPGGDWIPDYPSTDGNPWTRTGIPPKLTCRPSILMPRYHGFLTDGVLKSC